MTERDRAGRTPLHYAAIDGPSDLPNIAALDDPQLAAENARKSNEFKVANTKKLLDAGADVNAADDEGLTPLHFAASRRSVDVVRLLLAAGADVNAASSKGETPLYNAVRNTTDGSEPITRLLLDRGADPHATLTNGSSAISYVRRIQKPGIVELFADIPRAGTTP